MFISDSQQAERLPKLAAVIDRNGRDDWIRTSDLTHPKRARYQAAPRPVARLSIVLDSKLSNACYCALFCVSFSSRLKSSRSSEANCLRPCRSSAVLATTAERTKFGGAVKPSASETPDEFPVDSSSEPTTFNLPPPLRSLVNRFFAPAIVY